MSDRTEGPRVSRGEEALYGELAFAVRQTSTAYVALTEARDRIVEWLQARQEGNHGPSDESFADYLATIPQGSVPEMWRDAFNIVGLAEKGVEKALYELAELALANRKLQREATDSMPVFADNAVGHPGYELKITKDTAGMLT